ncbi:E3 ubiquitin-protein ligase HECTD1 [Fasciola gigantica]|uniref:E3 ubiquitin-protein ligase n=1 Tax=Fasciola gigantica TaxID=46835 RepID=A0A504YTY7_FASGI|nr:E3 ubiquitin-protein ligase HECTD1 [Fasciola gigantica]
MSDENAVFILNLLQSRPETSRDLQLTALEQLCLFILQMDTSEALKKEYPPSAFIPALVKLFVDFDSPAAVLESASRVLTYYTQILPLETASCLFEIEGSICAICLHLESSDLVVPVESDLAQQIIKIIKKCRYTFSSTNDVLLPTLHLADGLLNLSMSMMPSENTASAVDTVVVPSTGMPSSSSVLSPDFQRTQGTSLGVNQSECSQTSRFRKQWKACVTARLISPKPLEPLVNRDRCGLPNLRSLGSSSSGASAGDLVSILQSAQVSCNWLDSCGQPLLAWALAAGNGAALTALCTRGVDVNSGLVGSALHYAAAYGQVQIVRALLGLTPYAEKHGTENSLANPRLRDIYGRTPAQLALYALNAAYERGTNPERYRKSLKMLQKSEEQFKQELSIERTTPFAKLLRIALPVLTEVYLMTSKPSLRIRALQIICRCVRSKTGFGVLYQMQKWRPTEDEGILFKAFSANGSQFCNNFTRMLASVLSQVSRFQCMHELGYYQAYTFGDWCLMRTGPRSVLLFHEFALFWIDVVYIQSESKKETECQMQVYLVQRKENVPKVGQPSSSPPPPCSDERGCEKAAGTENKTEKIAKKYLLPSSASESADGLTVSLLQFDGPPIERNDLASDLWLKAHPLIVQIRHMFYGMLPLPLCKTASPLRTISTNATHVGKGRQPVLACSSDKGQALPLLPIQSTSNLPTEELSGTEPDGRTMNRLCAAASSENQQHSEEEDLVHASNALISDSLLPVTDNIANSSSSTNEMTTNPQFPLSSDCIFNVTVSFSNKAFSNCIRNPAEETSETRDFAEDEQLNNEQAMNISSHMENDDAKVEVRTPSRVLPRSQSNLEADRIKQTNPPKGTHEHVEASQDKTHFNPIRSDVLDHFKFRDITKNEQHGACENSVHPIKSTETKHEISEAIRETKTASAGLSIRYQANFEAPNSRQNLTASGKLTALYVDAIRISVSPQGLWLILDPRQDAFNQTTVPLTEDQQITVCSHPECQGKWNLDDSDDETVYNEATETTCWSASRYTEIPSSGHGTRTYERDWQKLRKILTNAADSNKSRECLREQLAYKQSKILCFPTRLSGVRTYGATSQIVYQSGSMTRSSGNLRHREARLRNIQRTVGRVSIILSDLLMRLMEKKRQSLKNKFSGTSHASCPTYQLVLANELSRYAAWLETYITPDTKMLIQGEELVDERTRITELMSCLEKATPYEIISSRFVPVLWSWLKESPYASSINDNTCNAKIFEGGVFEWLGTNGGREEKWANPLRLHGFVKLLSSDSKLNEDPVTLGSVLMTRAEKSHDADRGVHNEPSKPWRNFHKSHSPYCSRTRSCASTFLSGVRIRPASNTTWSRRATAWIAFDLGIQLELSHYLIQVPVHADKWPRLFNWQIQESAFNAVSYIQQFQPGTYVVPNVPLALCDSEFPAEASSALCEHWPISNNPTALSRSTQQTSSAVANENDIQDELPTLGRVLSSVDENGHLSVQWLDGPITGFSEKGQTDSKYFMDDAEGRFDLRIPTDKEVHQRMNLLKLKSSSIKHSQVSEQLEKDLTNLNSELLAHNQSMQSGVQETSQNMIPLATHSSNWEDANSLSMDQELENQNEAQRSAPYLTMSDQHEGVNSQSLFNELGAGAPTSGFSDGSPARDEVANCATSVPVIVAVSNSSLPPNPDDTHTATVIPSPGLDAASVQPTTICSELDERVPWKVMLAPDIYDSNEEDGGTEEDFRENDPEYGVETEENPEDSCAIFASFRALTDDTQKQEEMDAELEAIGRTLELRIMANASESGCSPHSPTHCPPLHTGSQTKPLHGKRRKFDQWEKIDPVDSEIISKQCMGISTVSTVLDSKTKLTHIQISTSLSNADANRCDAAPCVPCPSAPSFSVSQVDDPWKFLFDPLATSVDRPTKTTGVSQPGPSLLSPPPVPLAPHTPRDAHRMTQSMHSHKSTFRPQVTETIKVETIEAHLSGLIPPFDSRSSSAHQPSTATFTIPNCVPWPAIQWSRESLASSSNSYDTTLIGSGRKPSKTAQLWFHREPVMGAITVVLGSSLSTVSPRSSLSDSLGANPENASFLNNELSLHSLPFQNPLEPSQPQTKPVRYYLSRDDVHLLRYLLRESKHKEEVCNPPSFADSKMREKLLDSLAMLYEISTASRHRHTSRNSAMCVDQLDDYSGCEIETPIKRCSETNVIMSEVDRQDDADNDELLTAFQSSRMTRKLMLFAHDIWFVLSHTHVLCHTNSDLSEERRVNETVKWISPFVAKFKFLFPFEVRHEFWRVSSLGISRAISWLQKQAGNARTPNTSANLTGLSSMLQRLDVGMGFRERQNGRIFGPPVSFSWTPSTIMNTNSGFGSSAYGSSLGFANPPSLTALGRLQRHMARVPRPRTTFDSSEVCEDSDPLLYLCSPFLGGRNNFWCSSVRLLLAHADFQQELEVEFEGEEGTGLGPTMEFYALLSAELRRHKHGLWVSEDRACARTSDCLMRNTIKDESDTCQFLHSYQDTALDTECFWKSCAEEDFYVNPPMGLFPAPWPEEQLPPGVELRFYVLGVAVAKCLADQRQMDLPLSFSFLYLLTEEGNKESQLNEKLPYDPNSMWPSGILNIRHFSEIFPERGRFLSDLLAYTHERDAINFTPGSTEYERADLELQQRFFSCDLASLCISMAFSPVTMRFGQTEFPLTRRYDDSAQLEMANSVHDINEEDEQLGPSNADLYVHRSLQFALVHGIRRQLHAFRAGFERVIPLSSLSMFTPRELGRLISGESSPDWSAEEFLMYCEPAAGYSRTSKGFLMLVETLASFDTLERRAFLRFVTGCPTLPPGGLRNLHPKLKNEDRRIAGPDSPLWFIPPIAEQPEKIKLLAHHLSQAEKASRRRDHHTLFTSYLLLGRAFQDCPDDLWLAEHFLKYALKIAEAITDDDKLKLATAHQYYGLILQSRGQLIPAAVSLQEFYNLTRGKQWTNDCGVLLSNLATKYLVENYLKRIDESPEEYHSDRIRLCREAQEISLKCDQWNVEAPVWRRLGLLLEDAGQIDEALKTYKSYFEKASAKEDYTNLGLACEALAKLCQRQKRLEESIQHLQKFACVCERHGRWTELGRACQMLGSAYDAIGDHASGLKWMKKAYSLPHMIQCLKPEDFRESVEAARIMIGISRAHLMNKAYSINMLDECASAVSRVIDWKSEPFNEEEIFPIKELKLPPIKFKDRQPNRDVLKYALHPSTGFLHYK